jgi:hypothetical protein
MTIRKIIVNLQNESRQFTISSEAKSQSTGEKGFSEIIPPKI